MHLIPLRTLLNHPDWQVCILHNLDRRYPFSRHQLYFDTYLAELLKTHW